MKGCGGPGCTPLPKKFGIKGKRTRVVSRGDAGSTQGACECPKAEAVSVEADIEVTGP